jgi:uncharacterized protein YqgC (DUF456 family)
LAESLLGIIAVVLMVIAVIASLLPVVPGPALVWAIGLAYGVLTGFTHVTGLSLILMTLLMILGSTSGWWMQALGMHASGGSWLSIVGALVGGLIGTFAIPIPFLGTIVGLVLGALLFEFARVGEIRQAMQSGGAALRGYLLSVLVEGGISLLILAVFVISLIL